MLTSFKFVIEIFGRFSTYEMCNLIVIGVPSGTAAIATEQVSRVILPDGANPSWSWFRIQFPFSDVGCIKKMKQSNLLY